MGRKIDNEDGDTSLEEMQDKHADRAFDTERKDLAPLVPREHQAVSSPRTRAWLPSYTYPRPESSMNTLVTGMARLAIQEVPTDIAAQQEVSSSLHKEETGPFATAKTIQQTATPLGPQAEAQYSSNNTKIIPWKESFEDTSSRSISQKENITIATSQSMPHYISPRDRIRIKHILEKRDVEIDMTGPVQNDPPNALKARRKVYIKRHLESPLKEPTDQLFSITSKTNIGTLAMSNKTLKQPQQPMVTSCTNIQQITKPPVQGNLFQGKPSVKTVATLTVNNQQTVASSSANVTQPTVSVINKHTGTPSAASTKHQTNNSRSNSRNKNHRMSLRTRQHPTKKCKSIYTIIKKLYNRLRNIKQKIKNSRRVKGRTENNSEDSTAVDTKYKTRSDSSSGDHRPSAIKRQRTSDKYISDTVSSGDHRPSAIKRPRTSNKYISDTESSGDHRPSTNKRPRTSDKYISDTESSGDHRPSSTIRPRTSDKYISDTESSGDHRPSTNKRPRTSDKYISDTESIDTGTFYARHENSNERKHPTKIILKSKDSNRRKQENINKYPSRDHSDNQGCWKNKTCYRHKESKPKHVKETKQKRINEDLSKHLCKENVKKQKRERENSLVRESKQKPKNHLRSQEINKNTVSNPNSHTRYCLKRTNMTEVVSGIQNYVTTRDENVDSDRDKSPELTIDMTGDENVDSDRDKSPVLTIDMTGDENVDSDRDKSPELTIDMTGGPSPTTTSIHDDSDNPSPAYSDNKQVENSAVNVLETITHNQHDSGSPFSQTHHSLSYLEYYTRQLFGKECVNPYESLCQHIREFNMEPWEDDSQSKLYIWEMNLRRFMIYVGNKDKSQIHVNKAYIQQSMIDEPNFYKFLKKSN